MLIGIAKPMLFAFARTAALIPTTSPSTFINGPPELPGLMLASVCKKLKYPVGSRPFTSSFVRPFAERMPAETVCERPNGLPTATTQSPTSIKSESPRGREGKFRSSTCKTAMSVCLSFPTTFACSSRPSTNPTVTSVASSMTWLFVSMNPSES